MRTVINGGDQAAERYPRTISCVYPGRVGEFFDRGEVAMTESVAEGAELIAVVNRAVREQRGLLIVVLGEDGDGVTSYTNLDQGELLDVLQTLTEGVDTEEHPEPVGTA